MPILGNFFLLLIVCSVLHFYKRFLGHILGLLLMGCFSCFKFLSQNSDFGCGFLVFGCFRQFFGVLGLSLLFILGFKVLLLGSQFRGLVHFLCGFRGKSSDLRKGFCSKDFLDGKCNRNISNCGLLDFSKDSGPTMIGQLGESKETGDGNGGVTANIVSTVENGDDVSEIEFDDEDEVFDVMALRKLVKIERQRVKDAYLELEKERIAAATATEEAMAMIWRLQNEKSLIEMEANQYRRLAEEKQLHDQEVIQSLRWIVMKHQSDRTLLEDELRYFRGKMKLSVKGDEGDHSEGIDESPSVFNLDIEDGPGDALISLLDMDSSLQWNVQGCQQ